MMEFLQRKRSRQPQNPAQAKLAALANQLEQTATQPGSVAPPRPQQPDETLADDGQIAADKQAMIEADEDIIRPVLALFDIDYDALIRLDSVTDKEDEAGQYSPYARAVQANPALLQQVMQAERPVLAALKAALAFKPYAEFAEKYGDDPQSIRDKLREELRAEILGQSQQDAGTAAPGNVTPFSGTSYKATSQKNKVKQGGGYQRPKLEEILK
mgnify:CR=1 FL=1